MLETAFIVGRIVGDENTMIGIDLPIYNNIEEAGRNILIIVSILLLLQNE